MDRLNKILIVLMVSALAACGGGSSETTNPDNPGNDEGGNTPNLKTGINITQFVRASDNVETIRIANTDSFKVQIDVVDDDLSPMADELVELSVTSGAGTLNQQRVLTDSNGQATFNILPPSSASAGALNVTSAEYETSKNYEFYQGVDTSTATGGSIGFVGSEPSTISLKGLGGLGYQETSTLTFRVVDTEGLPIANQTVNFEFIDIVSATAPQVDPSLSSTTSVSNESGEVTVIVQSGDIAQTIRVKAEATIGNDTVSILSDNLVISTGVSDKDSFTVAFIAPVIEFDNLGDANEVVVYLADKYQNWVPDGTSVYFSTDLGSIDDRCDTAEGACSVIWRNQNPIASEQSIVNIVVRTKVGDPDETNIVNYDHQTKFAVFSGAINLSSTDLTGGNYAVTVGDANLVDASCQLGYTGLPTGSSIEHSVDNQDITVQNMPTIVDGDYCADQFVFSVSSIASNQTGTVNIKVTTPMGISSSINVGVTTP